MYLCHSTPFHMICLEIFYFCAYFPISTLSAAGKTQLPLVHFMEIDYYAYMLYKNIIQGDDFVVV